jgi:hypothetical protein
VRGWIIRFFIQNGADDGWVAGLPLMMCIRAE